MLVVNDLIFDSEETYCPVRAVTQNQGEQNLAFSTELSGPPQGRYLLILFGHKGCHDAISINRRPCG